MVLETSAEAPKRKRGRPRKTPLPETTPSSHVATSKSASSKASVVKTSQKSNHHDTASISREEELEAFERRSNKSGLLTLLVLLLGIALIGYGMWLKIHQTEENSVVLPANTEAVNFPQDNNTSIDDSNTDTGAIQPESIVEPISPVVGDTVVNEYFQALNKKDTTAMSNVEDTSAFATLATNRTYFNHDRLIVFLNNTVDGIKISPLVEVTSDPVLNANTTAKAYDLTISYSLKTNEQSYTDAWRVYTIVKNEKTVINSFSYQGSALRTSPFFNFSQYDIK